MLAQLKSDVTLVSAINKLKLVIVEQKKAGVLVIVDGTEQACISAFICQQAIDELNNDSTVAYVCFSYFLDDELFLTFSKQAIVQQLGLKHAINLMLDDAVDELILEVEYSYKKLGMSRHMILKAKQQLRSRIAQQTAEAIAIDMNVLLFPENI